VADHRELPWIPDEPWHKALASAIGTRLNRDFGRDRTVILAGLKGHDGSRTHQSKVRLQQPETVIATDEATGRSGHICAGQRR
jgi:hypothetical protein